MVSEVDIADASTTLGHDKHKAALLKAIANLRQQERECSGVTHSKASSVQPILESNNKANGAGARSRNDLPLSTETQAIEDSILLDQELHHEPTQARIPTCPPPPRSVFNGFDDTASPSQQYAPPEETSTSHIPTYPAVPKLQSSIETEGVHDVHTLTSRRKLLPKPSHPKLFTVIEDRPPTYLPTTPHKTLHFPLRRRTGTTSDEDDRITGLLDVPAQEQYSRTNTMSSTNSINSHQGPFPIYISPSMQLQGMQSIGEMDYERQRLRAHTPIPLTRSQASSLIENHTSSEVPSSTSNEYNIYKAHFHLNDTIRCSTSTPSEHICTRDWARSTEWVAPSGNTEGPTEWIEDFLVRREEADRLEAEERRRKGKEKRPDGLLRRVSTIGKNSMNKRRLSKRNNTQGRASFEARQESTRPRWHVQTPERDISRDQDQHLRVEEVHDIRKDSDSPPSDSRLSYSSPPRNSVLITTATAPSRSIQQAAPPAPPQQRFQSFNNPRSSKFTFRSVSKIRTTVKRSFSSSVVPAFNEGRNSVKDLVVKFERLGGSLKGLGRKGAVKKTHWRRGGETDWDV
jgi:hypothetical protein